MTAVEHLLRSSGEPRPRASRRTDAVMAALSAWVVLGLFLDAWAHANVPQLESFFTPWHAVFYGGFAATAGWVLWTVNRHVERGRRGLAAVPLGYGATVVALPVFAVSGAADMAWHTFFGIEKTTDVFFSPSHLGLLASAVVILTSPLRSAWADPVRTSPGWPAVATLAFAATMALLFLTYGNALIYGAEGVVTAFSDPQGRASGLAVRIVVTTLVLLTPLLLLARRWPLPFGAATTGYAAAALLSMLLTGFRNLPIAAAVVAAGPAVDLLARRLRPGRSRTAYWAFAALAPLVTWTLYLAAAMIAAGRVPTVVALWTGAPLVAALLGWALAVVMLPDRVAG
jgi:hypothetical protein